MAAEAGGERCIAAGNIISRIMKKENANFTYATLGSEDEILQLLALQQANLAANISSKTAVSQGFLTVQHDFALLAEMNATIPQVVAKDGAKMIGYALTMLPSFAEKIPVLQPMFALFDEIEYRHRRISGYRYYVMGQVCVAKDYRGMGAFDGLYQKHKELFAPTFDFCITEIASRNARSKRAHQRVGFKTIFTHQEAADLWEIVLWEW